MVKEFNYFNMTVSYRKNADVTMRYHELVKVNRPDYEVSTTPNQKQIVWIVSHCDAPSKRDNLGKKLKRYGLNITIYGGCGKVISDHWLLRVENCLEESVNDYKLYWHLKTLCAKII